MRQQIRTNRRWQAQAQHALQRRIAAGCNAADLVCVAEHPAGDLGRGGTNRRQQNARPTALDQLGPEPLLKRLDLLAQRRLGRIAAFSGTPEMPCIRECDEIFELPKAGHVLFPKIVEIGGLPIAAI